MSWWDTNSFSSFATQALKTAQQRIDKVLDIPDEEGGIKTSTEPIPVTTETVLAANESIKNEEGDFWGDWLGDKPEDMTRKILEEKKNPSSASGKRHNFPSQMLPESTKVSLTKVSHSESTTTSYKTTQNLHSPLIALNTSSHTTENVDEPLISRKKSSSDSDSFEKIILGGKADEKVEKGPRTSSSMRKSAPLKLGSKSSKRDEAEKSKITEDNQLLNEREIEAEIERQLSGCDVVSLENEGSESVPVFTMDTSSTREIPIMPTNISAENESPDSKPEHENKVSVLQPESLLAMTELQDSVNVVKDSDWGDVSLSIITESQISLGSQSEESRTKDICDGSTEEHSVCESVAADTSIATCNQEDALSILEIETKLVEGVNNEEMAPLSIVIPEEKVQSSENQADNLLQKQGDTLASQFKLDSESMNKSLTDSSDAPDELSESNRTITAEEFDTNVPDCECDMTEAKDVIHEEREHIETDESCECSDNVQSVEISTAQDQLKEGGDIVTKTDTETLTSSSYVKNMLEEAMVESLKDTDSHSDSHSSSEMVRVDSGHTSADEIDTTTSSDIEIISHISTPTPNGEYKDRPFDLSPLRHALSRSVRRGSPPGHKRSDSSSSGTSYQSRNGDDLLSPDGPPTKSETAESGRFSRDLRGDDHQSNPLETEKLLRHEQISPLQPIEENQEAGNAELAPHQFDSTQIARLLEECTDAKVIAKRLAEMAEVLDVREKKLVEMSRENMDIIETNNILRNQLHQCEEARESEMTDLNILTEEFTKRLSETDKKMTACVKDKDTYKLKLQAAEAELLKKLDNTATERLIKEKDQQIAGLLEEGEKLSKQQLQLNNNIKKLRVKEKENDAVMKSHKQKLENQSAEVDKLKTVLDNKIDNEKKHVDAITQLNVAVKQYEEETGRYKAEVEESQEKIRSMQTALDNSYREIAELHKAKAALDSVAQEASLSNEIRAKEELQLQLKGQQHNMRQQQESLINQIEDLQLSLTRMEREHGRREDLMRQEVSDLQQRLQEAEDRNQELTQSVTAATRPLLRQIENLQATYSVQVTSYEKVERNLTERLYEAQNQLAVVVERDRSSNDRMMDIDMKLTSQESQLSELRKERSRLQANLEVEKTKSEVLEEAKNHEMLQLESLRITFEKELNDVKKERLLMENQLEMEKIKVDTEKKKVLLVHEQLKDKEAQLQLRTLSQSPSFAKEGTITPIESPMNLSMTLSQFEDPMDKSMSMSMMSTNGNRLSLYESFKQTGATALVENLQSSLKMREGEISHLQGEISELERTRESMARELVNLSNKNEDLEEELKEFPEFKVKYQELNERYQALLQMYGEKVEEAQELRLDLQDVKDMYKSQINELLKSQGHELL